MNLESFNIFGSVRIDEHSIHVIATGVIEGNQSIEKVVKKSSEKPIYDVAAWPNAVVILFTANVNAAGKVRIWMQNFSERAGGPELSGHPLVKEALREATNQFR